MAEPTPAPVGTSTSSRPELVHEPPGVQRSAAAEGNHREPAEVLAVLHGVDAGRVGHVLVHHLGDAHRGRDTVSNSEGRGDDLHRLGGQAGRQRDVLGAECVGMQAAQADVGVGDGGIGHRRGRRRLGRAPSRRCCGPTRICPRASTEAMEPPPAPISSISITGIEMGMPLPFLKRAVRATSKVEAVRGTWSSMRAIFAVVPPMSKEQMRSRPWRAARSAAKTAPPAGPGLDRGAPETPPPPPRSAAHRPNG